jgi:hypothetical protein
MRRDRRECLPSVDTTRTAQKTKIFGGGTLTQRQLAIVMSFPVIRSKGSPRRPTNEGASISSTRHTWHAAERVTEAAVRD